MLHALTRHHQHPYHQNVAMKLTVKRALALVAVVSGCWTGRLSAEAYTFSHDIAQGVPGKLSFESVEATLLSLQKTVATPQMQGMIQQIKTMGSQMMDMVRVNAQATQQQLDTSWKQFESCTTTRLQTMLCRT